jgi:hypothetical protein
MTASHCGRDRARNFYYPWDTINSYVTETFVGTGGDPNSTSEIMQRVATVSGALIFTEFSEQSVLQTGQSELKLTEVGKQISLLRHYFSLSTTDLSRIFLVERPTIYSWMDGKFEPKQENRDRIREFYQLANRWRKKTRKSIGKLLKERMEGSSSLMDYMVEESLNMAAINRILDSIYKQVQERTEKIRAQSVREIAKRSGFKPLSAKREQELFDINIRF